MSTLLRAVIDATGLSRRKAFAAVRDGRVAVAGTRLLDPSADYDGGVLSLDDAALSTEAPTRTYLMLNKPPGYVSTRADERGRPTVMDLVPDELRVSGLHSVGRLDLDTAGLLLLTNDGDLTFRLTHPSHAVEKEYWVGLATPPNAALLEALRAGAEIDGEVRAPVSVTTLSGRAPYEVAVVIVEGRNRHVRRLFEAVGVRVRQLMRVREGDLRLTGLREGSVRPLAPRELVAIGIRPPAAARDAARRARTARPGRRR